MDNVLLGKTVKAMYKLSGKTLTQLSEETDLTVDTINNLFYARLQKPGFLGVSALVRATGYSVAELCGFMETAESLPANADITEEFTKYLFTVRDTVPAANPAKTCISSADATVPHDCCTQIRELTEEHERQLDRYRTMHLQYVEQLHILYKEQIAQMEESIKRLKDHYDHSVGEIKKAHALELERQDKQISVLKRTIFMLSAALLAAALAAILTLFL